MVNERTARWCFAATAALVWFGLGLQVILSASSDEGYFATAPGRVVNFFCFFTVQSNLCVAVTTTLLARRLHRGSLPFWTFRLIGVLAIFVTGIVFHLALDDLQELTGWDLLADTILHTLSPILTVVGWAVFGPRRLVTGQVVRWAVVPPIAWLAFTLVRGAVVEDRNGRNYYPYPFLDVVEHGYLVVAVNALVVAALFLGLAAAAAALDGRLPGIDADEPSAATDGTRVAGRGERSAGSELGA